MTTVNPLDYYQPGGLITPAGFAYLTSGRSWKTLPHLELINVHLVNVAIARKQGGSSNVLIMCPPQHGKTTLVSHAYPGWWLGHFPEDRVGLIGYEAEFAAKRGRAARDIFIEHGPRFFDLEQNPDIAAVADWGIRGHHGGMACFGAGGGITGNPMNLCLVDDPIKSEEQACSQHFRDTQWEWWTGTVQSRITANTSIGFIYTPWHEDDLGQRIMHYSLGVGNEPWTILRIPALSETQDERDEYAETMGLPLGLPDPVGREPGMALWPEKWPVEKLLARKRMNAYQFEAMFQGRPRPKGGSIFKGEWFNRCKASDVPKDAEFCRFWDKAGSDNAGDWTVGVLMARSQDGRFFVVNVSRDRLSAFRRDEKIVAVSDADVRQHASYRIRGDQDPASAGKSDAENFRRMLAKFDVKTAVVSGDKVTRARPFASATESRNVWLVEGEWNKAFIDELESFDKGKHDDQVDAASSAYSDLAGNVAPEWAPAPFQTYHGRVSQPPSQAARRVPSLHG